MRLVDQPGQGEWRAVWTLRPVRASTLKSRCWSTCDDDLGICLFSNPAAARFVRIVRRRCHCHVVPALSRDSRCEEISISHAFRSLARSPSRSVLRLCVRLTKIFSAFINSASARSPRPRSLRSKRPLHMRTATSRWATQPREGGISVSGRRARGFLPAPQPPPVFRKSVRAAEPPSGHELASLTRFAAYFLEM